MRGRAGAGTRSSSSSSSSRGGRAAPSARASLSWRAQRTACCALRGAFLVAAVALRGCIAALRSWCSGPRSAFSLTSSRSCPRAHERAPNFGCQRARQSQARQRKRARSTRPRANAQVQGRDRDDRGHGLCREGAALLEASRRICAPNRRVLVRVRWFRSARTRVRACADACVSGSHLCARARARVAACAHAVAHSGALVRRLSPRPRR